MQGAEGRGEVSEGVRGSRGKQGVAGWGSILSQGCGLGFQVCVCGLSDEDKEWAGTCLRKTKHCFGCGDACYISQAFKVHQQIFKTSKAQV